MRGNGSTDISGHMQRGNRAEEGLRDWAREQAKPLGKYASINGSAFVGFVPRFAGDRLG